MWFINRMRSQSSCNEIWQKSVVLDRIPAAPANQPNSVKPDGEFISLKLSSQNLVIGLPDSIFQHYSCIECAVMPKYAISWSYIPGLMCLSLMIVSHRYEWLDPSIKKTEWSREEEEKLSSPGQADAHSVEGHRPHHRTNSCSVSGAFTSICCMYSLMHYTNNV